MKHQPTHPNDKNERMGVHNQKLFHLLKYQEKRCFASYMASSNKRMVLLYEYRKLQLIEILSPPTQNRGERIISGTWHANVTVSSNAQKDSYAPFVQDVAAKVFCICMPITALIDEKIAKKYGEQKMSLESTFHQVDLFLSGWQPHS